MARWYAWLGQGCASLALATLLLGLAAWGTSGVWAEEFPAEPCPCLPDETPEECALRCGGEQPPNCGLGHPDCAIFVTRGDCVPGPAHQHKCNNDPRCACRWLPAYDGVYKCFCVRMK